MEMKRFRLLLLTVLFSALLVSAAGAATIGLFDFGFNVNGTILTPINPLPPSFNMAGFDFTTGIGTISIYFDPNAAGTYSVLSFFDHEIDEATNTYYNEYGSVSGAPVVGQSWEIDEPGYMFGDIYTNFQNGTLDNSNGVPSTSPDDVSMAMGWNFGLLANQHAVINLLINTTAPGGFYLTQIDPDSQASIYLSGTLTKIDEGSQVPEPSTIVLLSSAMGGIFLLRKRIIRR
jgi:hypothetical protein